MALSDAVKAVQTKARAISGIKEAPANPPESASQFPFAASFARTGAETPESAGWSVGLHTIVCEIHVARQVLAKDVEKAMPFYELFRTAILADTTIAGTCQTVNQLRYEFGAMQYGGTATIGFKFEIDIKLHGTF